MPDPVGRAAWIAVVASVVAEVDVFESHFALDRCNVKDDRVICFGHVGFGVEVVEDACEQCSRRLQLDRGFEEPSHGEEESGLQSRERDDRARRDGVRRAVEQEGRGEVDENRAGTEEGLDDGEERLADHLLSHGHVRKAHVGLTKPVDLSFLAAEQLRKRDPRDRQGLLRHHSHR